MAKYEIEMVKKYYRYVEVEAPDKSTALSLACDLVPDSTSECREGFTDYGNPYEAVVINGPTNEQGYII